MVNLYFVWGTDRRSSKHTERSFQGYNWEDVRYRISPYKTLMYFCSRQNGHTEKTKWPVRNLQIDRFTPRLSDMIGTIYRLKYLWSIKLMFCESKSRPLTIRERGLDLTCRVKSVSHSNCVAIQKNHVIFGDLSGHTSKLTAWNWSIRRATETNALFCKHQLLLRARIHS